MVAAVADESTIAVWERDGVPGVGVLHAREACAEVEAVPRIEAVRDERECALRRGSVSGAEAALDDHDERSAKRVRE